MLNKPDAKKLKNISKMKLTILVGLTGKYQAIGAKALTLAGSGGDSAGKMYLPLVYLRE